MVEAEGISDEEMGGSLGGGSLRKANAGPNVSTPYISGIHD